MKKIFTMCIIHKNSYVLLSSRKKGFAKNLWTGYYGSLPEGGPINEYIKDSLLNEVGIKCKNCEKSGILNFHFEEVGNFLEMHIFNVRKFSGNIIENKNVKFKWFKKDKIPYDKMWAEDKIWLPMLLEGKKFEGTVYFSNNRRLLHHDIKEIKKL